MAKTVLKMVETRPVRTHTYGKIQFGKLNPIANNKIIGVILLIFAVFGFLIIGHRLSYYVFEYDAQYSPVDYGKFNILSYFTVQSNFFFYVYLLLVSLSIFGVEKVRKFAFNPTVGALITVYIIIAGLVYCGGIPMGLTPPFKFDSATHSMSSFIQIYYHMIMPVVAIALWCFPFTNQRLSKKCLALSGIYPFVYSIFSMVRGAVLSLSYYPYPFYNPEFIWNVVAKDKPMNYALSYLVIFLLLVVGILFFVGFTALIMLIHNKRVER